MIGKIITVKQYVEDNKTKVAVATAAVVAAGAVALYFKTGHVCKLEIGKNAVALEIPGYSEVFLVDTNLGNRFLTPLLHPSVNAGLTSQELHTL